LFCTALHLRDDHDYENELKSVLKVHLYKKFIQIDASAKKDNELYFGHAGIKSDIPLISTIAIDLSKQTKGTKNENSVSKHHHLGW
jgi:hypothetical protein